MDRVIEEMSKAKSDVERRLRICIPEIIRECSAFGYLGKNFTFDVSNLSDKVNQRLISLSDEILSDIEERARKASEYAEEEDEWAPLILPYITRQIGEEDMVQRLDKHCSTLRYFLEGWIAIGMVNKLQEYELTNNIFAYLDNPLASPLWKEALNAGYLSNAIRSGSYIYGKGNQRNVLKALTEIEQYAINEAFQYGRILHFGKTGAIGYRTYRASSFPCEHCDELTMRVWPLDVIVLPAHPRCVCYSLPVYADGTVGPRLNAIPKLTPVEKRNSSTKKKKQASTVDNKAARADALDWARNNFTRELLPNGDTALRKRLTILETNEELILNTGFIEKVYSHNVRKDHDRLSLAMQIVMASDEWMPKLKYIRTEKGEHHGYPFKIYEGEYNGVKFELQAKLTDGIYPYLIKIK